MEKVAAFVWSVRGCKDKIAIPLGTKAVFVDMKYIKKNGQMKVSFNLTERISVLSNGLVSLVDSTLTLFSRGKTDGCSWELRGEGQETILGE